jgi:hypothetical protein
MPAIYTENSEPVCFGRKNRNEFLEPCSATLLIVPIQFLRLWPRNPDAIREPLFMSQISLDKFAVLRADIISSIYRCDGLFKNSIHEDHGFRPSTREAFNPDF